MTAEERMAYFQGEKRRVSVTETNNEKNGTVLILKIKFFICVILFVLFLSMDYTGADIQGITSTDIIDAVTSDISIDTQLWRNLLN